MGVQSTQWVKGDVLAFSKETILVIAGCMVICCAGVFLFLCRSAYKAKPGQSLAPCTTRHGSTPAAEGFDSSLPQFDCESVGALTPNLESIWTGSPIWYRSNDVKYLDLYVQSEQQIEGIPETNNKTTGGSQQIL